MSIANTLTMESEDSSICATVIVFLSTPLILLLLAAALVMA